jgi:uncharacterized RDD family membrane protein YckC
VTTLTTIETPERVAFTYDVAGLGTRVIAYLIDLLVRAAALLLLLAAAGGLFGRLETGLVPHWVVVAGILVFFALQWGYFTLFEAFYNGQTPGKRLLAIRVIKEGGYPASFLDVALRNLVRTVDFLPAAYGIGVIAIFFSSRHQRLGDIVAGTLVVRQSPNRPPSLGEILAAHSEADASAQDRSARLQLTVPQFEAIVEFLHRAEGLDPAARRRIAEKFAAVLRPRIAASKVLREKYAVETLDGEALLRLVVREGGEKGEHGEEAVR